MSVLRRRRTFLCVQLCVALSRLDKFCKTHLTQNQSLQTLYKGPIHNQNNKQWWWPTRMTTCHSSSSSSSSLSLCFLRVPALFLSVPLSTPFNSSCTPFPLNYSSHYYLPSASIFFSPFISDPITVPSLCQKTPHNTSDSL